MAIFTGATRRVAVIAETAWGTTPSGGGEPIFQVARITGGAMQSRKMQVESNEIRADANVVGTNTVGWAGEGSYQAELSYGGWFHLLLESLLLSTWTSNVLKNGVTHKSMTVEETFLPSDTAKDLFFRWVGCEVASITFTVPSNGLVTLAIEMMAKGKEADGFAILTSATYTAAATSAIFGALVPAVITLTSPTLGAIVESLTFTITNENRRRPDVEQLESNEFGHGRVRVTGQIRAYFETPGTNAVNLLWDEALNPTGFVLTVTLGHTVNEKYQFVFPNCEILSPERDPGGSTDDVFMNLPFQAFYDSGEAASIKINRAAAVV